MKFFLSLLTLSTWAFADISLPQNFKTDFNQTITNDKGKVIKYEGTVVFKNYSESLFKWSYTSPTKKEVCTNGVQLIVIDHDLEQIAHYLIQDSINLEEILKVAKMISKKDYKATYKDVEYLISLDDKEHLSQIVYVDNLDNAVKIIFKNMNYDTLVNDEDLACTAPQDYDEIKG